MTPVWMAAAVYEAEPCARSFKEDLEAHLQTGYVFSTPTAFVMGRPVYSGADPAQIVDPWHGFDAATCDAWLIYLAAGNIADVLRQEPFPLTFFMWERKNVLRRFYAKTVKRICSQFLLSRPSFCGRYTAPPSLQQQD
jgi:hypothetical protein